MAPTYLNRLWVIRSRENFWKRLRAIEMIPSFCCLHSVKPSRARILESRKKLLFSWVCFRNQIPASSKKSCWKAFFSWKASIGGETAFFFWPIDHNLNIYDCLRCQAGIALHSGSVPPPLPAKHQYGGGGGCIARSYYSFFSPSSPGFDSRYSQEFFSGCCWYLLLALPKTVNRGLIMSIEPK